MNAAYKYIPRDEGQKEGIMIEIIMFAIGMIAGIVTFKYIEHQYTKISKDDYTLDDLEKIDKIFNIVYYVFVMYMYFVTFLVLKPFLEIISEYIVSFIECLTGCYVGAIPYN